MLISLNWLRDYVDIPATVDPRALAERFTTTTAEVETVEHVTELPAEIALPTGARVEPVLIDDWIIEIDNKSITHRPDLWGHYGIAREVAAMLGLPLRPLPLVALEQLSPPGAAEIPITIDDSAKCARYTGLRMRGLAARPSPAWMQIRLARVGMRPISLLVDLTNYIMSELGQPMHAFDAATVDRIEVAVAGGGEKFRTLDNVERVVPAGTLMIQRSRRNVAVAGVMGGAETEVTPHTQEILLESANFDAATIRRAAAGLGLRTEASTRFEKSLDPNLTVTAIARFVQLACAELPDLSLTSRLSDCCPRPLQSPTIALSVAHVGRIIGEHIPRERIVSILEPLEFVVRGEGDRLEIVPPTFRATKDISIAEDVIEEVARFVGYDHIRPELPRVAARPLAAAADHVVERRTRELLCLGGAFVEVNHYVWYDDEWLARIGFDPGGCVTLRNPVSPHLARLRTSLMPGLYQACERNRHRVGSFELLEIGSVFGHGGRPKGDASDTPQAASELADVESRQHRRLGLAVVRSGRGSEEETWNALRAAAETWAGQVARLPLSYEETAAHSSWEDAVRCCTLRLDKHPVGRASLVPLESRMRVDERMRTMAIGLLEIDLSGLDPDALAPRKLLPPPSHPEVQVDFSFLADARRRWAQLAEDLRVFNDPLLRRIHFVEAYEGGSIPAGRRSFTIRTVLGDPSRTLGDADLKSFRDAFTRFLTQLGLELRG